MANLEEKVEWANGVYQLETTDPVMGGPNGIDNLQAKQLANRTQYLKYQIEINASTETAGRVKLNSAIDSVLETEAATPLAVKIVYDLASSAQNNAAHAQRTADSVYSIANTAKSIAETNASTETAGRVKLNSAVDSVSEKEAATPKAVKVAYDTAITANNNAISANSNANNAHKNIEVLGGRISNIEHKFVPTPLESRVYSNDKKTYLLVRDDGIVAMYNTEKNKMAWAFDANGELGIGTIHSSHVVGLNERVENMFTQSFGQNGYTRLPNGLIIQWGIANNLRADGKNGTLQSFFIAFPNACFSVVTSDVGDGVNPTAAAPVSNSQFRCWGKTPINGAPYSNTSMFYMAVGF